MEVEHDYPVDPSMLVEAVEYAGALLLVKSIKSKQRFDSLVRVAIAFLKAPSIRWCFEHGVEANILHRGRVEEGENPCRVGRARIVPEESV